EHAATSFIIEGVHSGAHAEICAGDRKLAPSFVFIRFGGPLGHGYALAVAAPFGPLACSEAESDSLGSGS
ncbi:MAG: hypothetical protein WBW33_19040, partial [Bryobacteraceae bacterium]